MSKETLTEMINGGMNRQRKTGGYIDQGSVADRAFKRILERIF
jgi:hypothetical protein